jgi:hypothetical protein
MTTQSEARTAILAIWTKKRESVQLATYGDKVAFYQSVAQENPELLAFRVGTGED